MIWSLDQTLIWIATGKIDAVDQVGQQKGKLWLDYALDGCDKQFDNLTQGQPPKPDAEAVVKFADGVEWSRENLRHQPLQAVSLLIDSIRNGDVHAYAQSKRVGDCDWFFGAQVEFDANGKAYLANKSGGNPLRMAPEFDVKELMERFPAASLPLTSETPADAADVEAQYLAYIAKNEAEGRIPTINEQDAEFFSTFGLKRESRREIRKLAPERWKQPGLRPKRRNCNRAKNLPTA